MASSREAQEQLGVGCPSTDLQLPFRFQRKLIFPLCFLSCFGGSHLAASSFSLHNGEVRGSERSVCKEWDQGSRMDQGRDDPGSLTFNGNLP